MTNETAMATTEAWHNYTLSLAPFGVVSVEQMTLFPTWYELYDSVFNRVVQNGGNLMLTSRLLSRDTVANKYAEVAEILASCNAGLGYVPHASSYLICLTIWNVCSTVAGGKVTLFDADSAGLNPARQNTVVESTCGITWEHGASSTEIQGKISQLQERIKAMHDLTPDDGTYFNAVRLVCSTRDSTCWRTSLDPGRHLCSGSIGNRPFSARIIRLSRGLRTQMIRIGCWLLQRASDLRTGTRT